MNKEEEALKEKKTKNRKRKKLFVSREEDYSDEALNALAQ